MLRPLRSLMPSPLAAMSFGRVWSLRAPRPGLACPFFFKFLILGYTSSFFTRILRAVGRVSINTGMCPQYSCNIRQAFHSTEQLTTIEQGPGCTESRISETTSQKRFMSLQPGEKRQRQCFFASRSHGGYLCPLLAPR